MIKYKSCEHISSVKEIRRPGELVCETCVQQGTTWVHLRTCQECGVTLCCDSSPEKHATTHYHQTGHAVTASAEPGEKWFWCYADERFYPYDNS